MTKDEILNMALEAGYVRDCIATPCDDPRYTYERWSTGSVYLNEGNYTRKHLEALLEIFNRMDRALEKSIKETK
jgi:hypothetical protein